MRGIILAGGTGSRLSPLTNVTNKHLLPVGNRVMIDHPIATLKEFGIHNVMVVSGVEHAGSVFGYCGSGSRYDMHFNYAIQDEANGIAGALSLCEAWASQHSVAVILGDNIFEAGALMANRIQTQAFVRNHPDHAMIFLKEVDRPERFGVVGLNVNKRIVDIVEKPENPPSNLAITGCYVLPPSVWGVIKTLKPSGRGELEITDVLTYYLNHELLFAEEIASSWSDAGTPESYRAANEWAWKELS